MKKVYYTNVRYEAIIKFVHKDGTHEWLRQGQCDITEAKRLYSSFKNAVGERIHKASKDGKIVFHGHLPNAVNGLCGGILLEEIKPFYFE